MSIVTEYAALTCDRFKHQMDYPIFIVKIHQDEMG